MRVGLALPQYDYSVAGERPLRFETVLRWARRAEQLGFDSLWLSDHVVFDLAKYGGSDERYRLLEPLTTLAALAREVPRIRLGTLVLCDGLRPPGVLAKALASLDRITGGRLDIGLGAGWYPPDFEEIGVAMPDVGSRIDQLRSHARAVAALLEGAEPDAIPALASARLDPPVLQQPRPRVFIGGKGDRVIRAAIECSDGWNTSWVWTDTAYRGRLRVVDEVCDRAGRDPATVWRTLGLYALCGEDERDLATRFERLRSRTPPGILDGMSLAAWRVGRLVGTVPDVAAQADAWASLGVETLIVSPGAVPYHVSDLDDLEPLAAALGCPAG